MRMHFISKVNEVVHATSPSECMKSHAGDKYVVSRDVVDENKSVCIYMIPGNMNWSEPSERTGMKSMSEEPVAIQQRRPIK